MHTGKGKKECIHYMALFAQVLMKVKFPNKRGDESYSGSSREVWLTVPGKAEIPAGDSQIKSQPHMVKNLQSLSTHMGNSVRKGSGT